MHELAHTSFRAAAAARPDAVSVVSGDGERWTYGALAAHVTRAAAALHAAGVGHGDRVVLSPGDGPVAAAWLLGTLELGAVFVFVAEDAPAAHLRYVADDAAARAAVLAEDDTRIASLPAATVAIPAAPLPPADDSLRPSRPTLPGDVACLIYTSGSTGRPKGVVCPHRSVAFASRAIAATLGLRRDDLIGCVLPLTFDYGLYQLLLAWSAGAAVLLAGSRALPLLPDLLARHRVTVLPLVPSLMSRLTRLLARPGAAAPAVRLITSTGERLSPAVADRITAALPGAAIAPMYGLTECKRVSILRPAERAARPTSVGRPLPGTQVAVVAPGTAEAVASGEQGELVVRGPHVMAGYWCAPEATARRFRTSEPGGAPALFTGDIGTIDEDGFLYVYGRSDDLFKVSGHRIGPGEIEEAARSMDAVDEAAVLAPDGDAPFTLVISGGARPDDVRAGLAQLLEPHKVPPRILTTGRLPVTAHGKVDRRALAAMAARP